MNVTIDGLEYIPITEQIQLDPSEYCPECGSINYNTIDSRMTKYGTRRRTKECIECGTRWHTREHRVKRRDKSI